MLSKAMGLILHYWLDAASGAVQHTAVHTIYMPMDLLLSTILFSDNANCQFTVAQYTFPVTTLISSNIILIAHIFLSDWIPQIRNVKQLKYMSSLSFFQRFWRV